ncbi:MAG: AraC family transcriptional regulator [Eubacteriales bacterium]|nr:AraC family transcriptional regulator [Eubacteriales bacterium]
MEEYYELHRDEMNRTYGWHSTNDYCVAHFHSSIEMLYVESGSIVALQNGVSYHVLPGHMIVNSCYDIHSYLTPEHSRSMIVIIPLATVPALGQQLEHNHFAKSDVDLRQLPEVVQLMKMLSEPANRDQLCYMNSLGQAALALLIARIGLVPNEINAEANLIKRILKYLQAHKEEPLTVTSVAAHFGYSAGRFSHIFNERVGCPLTRYVNNLRCRNAQQLMQTSDAPLTEIAELCGFSSIRTFHRVYREVIGETPRLTKRASVGQKE